MYSAWVPHHSPTHSRACTAPGAVSCVCAADPDKRWACSGAFQAFHNSPRFRHSIYASRVRGLSYHISLRKFCRWHAGVLIYSHHQTIQMIPFYQAYASEGRCMQASCYIYIYIYACCYIYTVYICICVPLLYYYITYGTTCILRTLCSHLHSMACCEDVDACNEGRCMACRHASTGWLNVYAFF